MIATAMVTVLAASPVPTGGAFVSPEFAATMNDEAYRPFSQSLPGPAGNYFSFDADGRLELNYVMESEFVEARWTDRGSQAVLETRPESEADPREWVERVLRKVGGGVWESNLMFQGEFLRFVHVPQTPAQFEAAWRKRLSARLLEKVSGCFLGKTVRVSVGPHAGRVNGRRGVAQGSLCEVFANSASDWIPCLRIAGKKLNAVLLVEGDTLGLVDPKDSRPAGSWDADSTVPRVVLSRAPDAACAR